MGDMGESGLEEEEQVETASGGLVTEAAAELDNFDVQSEGTVS